MPTGFTARLYEGEQDFKDFVRNAARGMGAFIHLREASWETPLTYPEDGTPRAREELIDALRKNTDWRLHMSEEDKYAEWSDYVARTEAYNDPEKHKEFYARRDRFDAMIAKVEATEVPEKLQSFKDFMLQQLGTEFEYRREPYTSEPLDFYEWCEHETKMRQRVEDLARERFRNARERYWEVCDYIDLLGKTFGFKVEGK
jgi:hypothetical protein